MAIAIQSPGSQIETSDGVRLYLRTWPAGGPLRGAITLLHGYGEHSGRYEIFAQRFAPLGLAVYSCDLRGHGRSPGPRGYVRRFDDYLRDAGALVQHVRRIAPDAPLLLLGHSLGGLIAARYAEETSPELAGLVLSSPFIRLKMPVPIWKRAAAALLSQIAPAMPMPSDLPLEWLTHDAEIVEATRSDPLSHQTATPRWFTETQRAQRIAIDQAPEIRVPVALLLAGDDRIADIGASEQLVALAKAPTTVYRYDGMFHELFNEIDREAVYRDLEGWIAGRLD